MYVQATRAMRLAIVVTHPVQYYAPVFKLLHQRKKIDLRVYYTWGENSLEKYDPGFNKTIAWDIPVLEGYPFEWVKNTAGNPGSHHFKGIVNPDLITQINSWQPNAILFFGYAYHGHLKAIRYYKNKIPVYFRGDSTLLDEKKGLRSLMKSLYLKWVYKHIDHAFYVGTNNKAYYKRYGLKDSQLSFAPHAIDNQRFAEDKTADANTVREKKGIKPDEILILFAGKLEDKKSPVLLLDAFLTLPKNNVHLLFLGSGILEASLKLKAKDAANVHFISFQNQMFMPAMYQACDLFCLPSGGPGETWGLTVNEAMACKKAVLVSDKVGCAADLVKNNYNGRIFKSNDVKALVECLTYLTISGNELRYMGEKSALLIKDWDFLKIAEAIENKLMNEIN